VRRPNLPRTADVFDVRRPQGFCDTAYRCKNCRVDVDHPERDEQWDRSVRHEIESERLDRN
jgi:hypothetical protein